MRKCRLYSLLRKTLSALLCLSMMLSIVTVTDFSGLFHFTEKVKAADAPDPKEYEDETLEHMWDSNGDDKPDDDFLDAARPNYACRGDGTNLKVYGKFGGVEYRTIFHVYAFEGDTICVGSSVCNSTLDINHNGKEYDSDKNGEKGSVDIVMTDLNGKPHAIDIRNSEDEDGKNNTTGYIPDWETEWAAVKYLKKNDDGTFSGTYNDTTGEHTYTPYTYTVTETGVYTFEFHSYNKSGNGNSTTRKSSFETSNKNGLIAALNLTVFDESGEEQHGRTYADFLSLEMDPTNGIGVKDSYYILTTDSYIYKMQFNNASPYTYNFFANNRGIVDRKDDIVYKSVKDTNNTNNYDDFDICYRYPGTKDTDLSKSFFIFLEYPDDDLYGHLYERALLPDPAEDIRFIDMVEYEDEHGEKQTVPGSYTGLGGWFEFKVGEATTATLRLEFKNIKENASNPADETLLSEYAPVEISGVVTPNSRNRFYWDGCDGNGVPIPPGKYSIEDIMFTVTAKAGEIHFPIIDMENAKDGITFTRLSHIYDKDGNQLDKKDSIYDLTKNVIYYDDTAIYYGEQVTATGTSENKVTLALNKENQPYVTNPEMDNTIINFFKNLKGTDPKRYWTYNNMCSNGGEYIARQNSDKYISSPTDDTVIRVGDHSHTTNIIKYFDEEGNVLKKGDPECDSELKMIRYLDSSVNPVGKSSGTGIGYKDNYGGNLNQKYVCENVTYAQSTTDYGIANFWAFIPAKPEVAKGVDQNITIVKKDSVFNLIGRVFYDTNEDGKFQESSTDGEYAIPGVKLSLYKNVDKTHKYDLENHTYVDEKGTVLTKSTIETATKVYESVASAETALTGSYIFKGLEYDSTKGTEYLYKVEKPNISYELTSKDKKASDATYFCKNYTYGTDYTGTEVQIIKVGGGGIDPTRKLGKGADSNPNLTVCAADVGYYYKPLDHSVTLIKNWETTETHPDTVLFELSYKLKDDNNIMLYGYRTLSGGNSWQVKEENLPSELDGKKVDNYFVSAEYYIKDENVYRQSYDFNTSLGKYESFVGKAQYASTNEFDDITSFSSLSDLSVLKSNSIKWKDCAEKDTYKAVLDRDMRSDNTTITITNSKELGTIEILKYVDSPEDDKNHLAGATFRVYEGEMTTIKDLVEKKDNTKLTSLQKGSGTTRSNGRIAFPGLDPTKTYTVRERYAPDGYRILEEFYEVKPQGTTGSDVKCFDKNNYVELQVGNALADTDFKIRKRISGRAWQKDDTFTFTIKNTFDGLSLNQDDKFVIDETEQILYKNEGTDDTTLLTYLQNFIDSFSTKTITINDDRPYYSYTSKGENLHDVTISSSDTKVSNSLLGTERTTENATFLDVEFPLAGTYTFTVTENKLTSNNTLNTDPRTYTVYILVRRELDDKDGNAPIDLTNSHLVAEVLKITYADAAGETQKVFAGSSPLFTNTYVPAPAKQETSYKIVKNFTGRDWADTDNFTINIEGIDTETQNAVKDGQLTIAGFKDETTKTDTGWTYTVQKPLSGSSVELPFKSFDFQNIVFPVQYVNTADDTDVKDTLTDDEKNSGKYKAKTMPVTYWLKIKEDIPTDAVGNVKDGITYDNNVYYLKIVLRNAEQIMNTEKEEEDGIIDEIDMNLYYVDSSVTDVSELTKENCVATCNTVATVLEESAWKEDVTGPIPSNESYAWFYVTKSGELRQATNHTSLPSDYKLLVRRHEVHTDKEGTGGHTMTFSNIYHTIYSWSPQVQKILNGREWLDGDKFTFDLKCTSAPAGIVVDEVEEFSQKITITNADSDFKKSFKEIKFTVPGDYVFTIEETSIAGNLTTTVKDTSSGSYTINVTFEDDGKGGLTPKFNGYNADAAINFTNVYADKEKDFDLNISKQIIGRNWNDTDSFTFQITPDDNTKKAIKEEYLKMPDGLIQETDGSYKVTVQKSDIGVSSADIDTVIKSLGKIQILKGTEDAADYQFDITELDIPSGMRCRESKIHLTINVNRVLDTNSLPTGDLSVSATYAYMSEPGSGTTIDPTKASLTMPFINECMGKLTVAKKVVSSAETDTTPFKFQVEFTFAEDADTKYMTATHSASEAVTSDGVKYSFTLKDGENVTFDNIPPYTGYKISETDASDDKYVLLRVRDGSEDSEDYNMLEFDEENSVSGTINGDVPVQYRLFVNGLIRELPSAGGGGIDHIIFLGTAFTVSSILLIAMLFYKRRRRI